MYRPVDDPIVKRKWRAQQRMYEAAGGDIKKYASILRQRGRLDPETGDDDRDGGPENGRVSSDDQIIRK